MKIKATIVLLGALTLLTACGGTKQDPLADQSQAVKDGIPPGGPEKAKEKPLPADVLKIDGPDFFSFDEGEEASITINARSMFDDSQYTLEIVNKDDFKTAKIVTVGGDTTKDQLANLNILWKVPKGTGADYYSSTDLEVNVYTTNLPENYSFKKTFKIFINSDSKRVPEVIRADVPAVAIKENATGTFKIYVKDEDATDVNGARPSLFFTADNFVSSVNGSSFLSVSKEPTPDPTTPNVWVFEVNANLSKAEITAGNVSAKYFVYAKSRFGKVSNPYNGNFPVWTSVTTPISSWTEAVNFTRNQPNSYSFTVTDPKGEGEIQANFTTNCATLENAPTCTCKPVNAFSGKFKGAAQCTIKWTPPQGFGLFFSTTQTFTVNVTNLSPVSGDTDKKVQQFNGVINLVN
jgi:hypothetical protein